MEAPWGSPTVSFTSGLPGVLNFPGWAWAQTGTGWEHTNSLCSWMKLSASMREVAVSGHPHLLTSGQVSWPHPRKGVSLYHCQVKSTEPQSLGNAAQRCDSVGVLSLIGMGRGTLVSPGEAISFQGPGPSADAPLPTSPSGGTGPATASTSETNTSGANRTSSTTGFISWL